MSSRNAMTTPLKAEIRIFNSQNHLDVWKNSKKVEVYKSNIPGLALYIVNCSSYGDLLVIPLIVEAKQQ